MKFSMIYFLLCVYLFTQMFADCWRTRIIGGNDVTDVNQYPWMAQLLIKEHFFCGGSLINSKYVLTAAHCVKNKDKNFITIHLMILKLYETNTNTAIIRRVNRIVMHNYSIFFHKNDIALLRLDSDVIIGTKPGYPRPISLPPKGKLFSDMNGTIIGWGTITVNGVLPKVLQELTVPILSNRKCFMMGNWEISQDKICAGFRGAGKGACFGDSGGPLMVQINSQYHIIGIVSYGIRCAEYPVVFTRVSQYLEWILKNTMDK